MASKTAVLTSKAPKPLPGIYSQAIICNGMVYCSGAVPMDPETGKLIDGDVKAHTVLLPYSCLRLYRNE
jgi:enamine deaminase RidA (YjgF/YER057c/UK114 family)